MEGQPNPASSSFAWNAGGWFGSQAGCTLWLLILGLLVFQKDAVSGGVCLASFALLNAWGLYLWRRRGRLSAYAGLQRFLFAASVLIAVVVYVLNARGVAEPPAPGAFVSTSLPYWVVAMAPALMLVFFLREHSARRGRK